MEYFALTPEERAEHLGEVLQESVAFFERFKHIMKSGTPEEKQEMIEKVRLLQSRMQEESSKVSETTGMNDEQMKEYIGNKENFSDDQWNMIQTAKTEIEQQADEIKETLNEQVGPPPKGKPSETTSNKKKGGKKRKGWMKS